MSIIIKSCFANIEIDCIVFGTLLVLGATLSNRIAKLLRNEGYSENIWEYVVKIEYI